MTTHSLFNKLRVLMSAQVSLFSVKLIVLNRDIANAVRLCGLLAATLLICSGALADASRVMNYSDSKILSVGAEMAEAVSANAPVRVDKITVMLGAVFVRQTKTFIYKYETSQILDLALGKSYVIRHTCADPMRKAYMYRGIVFRHTYITPGGQQMFDVRYSDC